MAVNAFFLKTVFKMFMLTEPERIVSILMLYLVVMAVPATNAWKGGGRVAGVVIPLRC